MAYIFKGYGPNWNRCPDCGQRNLVRVSVRMSHAGFTVLKHRTTDQKRRHDLVVEHKRKIAEREVN